MYAKKVLGFKSTVLNARGAYGPLTLSNFLDNLSRNAVARQVAGELHGVTWVVSQFFYFFFLQQLATPLHSVSPLQQLYSRYNKGAWAHFLFFVPRSIAKQVAEKIAMY